MCDNKKLRLEAFKQSNSTLEISDRIEEAELIFDFLSREGKSPEEVFIEYLESSTEVLESFKAEISKVFFEMQQDDPTNVNINPKRFFDLCAHRTVAKLINKKKKR